MAYYDDYDYGDAYDYGSTTYSRRRREHHRRNRTRVCDWFGMTLFGIAWALWGFGEALQIVGMYTIVFH